MYLRRVIVQKIAACFVCILALLTVSMPVIIAEDNQFSTGNTTLNQTQNATGNVSLNQTQNATQDIKLNEIHYASGESALNETPDTRQSTSAGIAQDLTQTQDKTAIGAQNTNQPAKVLRAGFEKTKPLNNLDMYGNKSTYSIPASNISSAFDLSQRRGNMSRFTYNTGIYKPIYNVSQYSRIKPTYEVPSTAAKPVYSISGYPVIKAPNSIP